MDDRLGSRLGHDLDDSDYCFPMDDRQGCMMDRAGPGPQTRTRIRLLLFKRNDGTTAVNRAARQADKKMMAKGPGGQKRAQADKKNEGQTPPPERI